MAVVKYFGAIAEAVQIHEQKLNLDGVSVRDFMSNQINHYKLSQFEITLALNKQIVPKNSDNIITDSDEIALLPPFAGG